MILIALGANVPSAAGETYVTLQSALTRLRDYRIEVVRCSRFYRSSAWPDPSDPPFVNAVAELRTEHSPADLLQILHEIEDAFGRERKERNAPRTLDLDLIDYDGRVEEGPPVLPHPRMETRSFVLIPLRDVAPGWRHPVSGKTVSELIAVTGKGDVVPLR